MTKSIMVRAHQLARGFTGDYAARMSLALRQAWAEARAPKAAGLNLSRGVSRIGEAVIKTEAHSGWSKGWLARVTLAAPGGRFDLDRSFVRADMSDVNRAGNGTLTYKLAGLADGVYEADSVRRSMESQRTYFRVAAGAVVEVYECKTDAKAALIGKVAA